MQSPLLQNIVTEEGVKIHAETKRALLNAFWPQDLQAAESFQTPITTSNLDSYFTTYVNQCNAYLSQRGSLVITRTHQDIVDIIFDFKNDLNREQVHANLLKSISSDVSDSPEIQCKIEANSSRAIDLAVRNFLMMRIGKVPHSITSGTPLEWTHGTLRQFVTNHFNVPQELSYTGIKLPRTFNAHSLERIGGVKIKWTDNLADHLRMLDDDERVAVFAHPSFLMLHSTSDFFPQGFIEETLRTIKLLFPANDKPLQKWVRPLLSSTDQVDSRIATCGTLRSELRHIEKFSYWRDRLIILKEVFDEAEPSTLSQWWWDRRKRVQWYTFWIAVLVLTLGLIFGIIQSTFTILQTHVTLLQAQNDQTSSPANIY
ncbi:hypothetical protein B0T21DRAFT_384183 [Apiosordaria backusii]|uniref:Uncharacterized protein n=1 Tax=Apiosordaria backusii TaxID=314023 RepID=A0AA40BMA4_9PEZI|nr:hypothetical protein B0T21DRAFT_384183 [Apiosordaria backusii]